MLSKLDVTIHSRASSTIAELEPRKPSLSDNEWWDLARAYVNAGRREDAVGTYIKVAERVPIWATNLITLGAAEDYINTGDRIYVEGRLEYGVYERDGVTIPTSEVTVREVVLLSSKSAAVDEELEDAA